MFDSVAGGIIPICVLAVLAGIALASVRSRRVALFLAVVVAIAISYAWYWLPLIIWPPAHIDPQGGWDLVATILWSVFSIPTAVATLLLVKRRQAAKAGAAA